MITDDHLRELIGYAEGGPAVVLTDPASMAEMARELLDARENIRTLTDSLTRERLRGSIEVIRGINERLASDRN